MIHRNLEKSLSKNINTLIAAFFAVLMLVGTVTFISSQSVNRVTSQTDQLIQTQIPELRHMTNLQITISDVTNHLFEYYATLDRKNYLLITSKIGLIQAKIDTIEQLKAQPEIAQDVKQHLAIFMKNAKALDEEMNSKDRSWDQLRESLYAAQKASKSIENLLIEANVEIEHRLETNGLTTQHEVEQLNYLQIGFSLVVLVAVIFIISNLYLRIKDRSELFKRAYLNDITQLPNRKYFENNFGKNLERGPDTTNTYLFVGLDQFNLITGAMGYVMGDKLIKSISLWLGNQLEVMAVEYEIYQFTSTSWLIVLPEVTLIHDANYIVNSILNLSSTPMKVDNREMSVNCSIGTYLAAENHLTFEELLQSLDIALRQARQSGGNCAQQFVKKMSADAQAWLNTENSLRYAIDKHELELFYQPKIDTKTGKICSSEALIRWRRDGELISPSTFIPIAENSRLIIKIGQWVLNEACEQWSRWKAQGLPALPVAVNVSPLQFQEPDFPAQVRETIKKTGIPPAMLELEITEEAATFDAERVVDIMHELKVIGVSLAIDDFGTGYSSLSHLKRFPVDILKIDRSFVRDLSTETSAEASIVQLILKLAQQLDVKVVAEGIETVAQQHQLTLWQCDYLQGYLFSKPIPADEFAGMINHQFSHEVVPNPNKNYFRALTSTF